jgi:serine/threonine-protein kinase
LRTESPGPYRFWYRDSPRYFDTSAEIAVDTPALDVSGMNSLYLDLDGRLHWFIHAPPQREHRPAPRILLTGRRYFVKRARPCDLSKTTSTWVPLHAYDERAAWDGSILCVPSRRFTLRLLRSAANQFTSKRFIPGTSRPVRSKRLKPAANGIYFCRHGIFMIALIGSALVARHNLRLGRGDVSGAVRIAFVYFVCAYLSGYLSRITTARSRGNFSCCCLPVARHLHRFYLWLLYIALEPFVRRRWPHRIISWSRLLRGDFRDPLVGRHILIGSACGALIVALTPLTPAVMRWLGITFDLMANPVPRCSGHTSLPLFGTVDAGLFVPFMMFFLLLLFVTIVRNEWYR